MPFHRPCRLANNEGLRQPIRDFHVAQQVDGLTLDDPDHGHATPQLRLSERLSLIRAEMDVASAPLAGPDVDPIRRFQLQPAPGAGESEVDGTVLDLDGPQGINFVDRSLHVLAPRDRADDGSIEDKAKLVDQFRDIGAPAKDDVKRPILDADRQGTVLPRDRFGHQFDRDRIDSEVRDPEH